jgi:hypothetical protein
VGQVWHNLTFRKVCEFDIDNIMENLFGIKFKQYTEKYFKMCSINLGFSQRIVFPTVNIIVFYNTTVIETELCKCKIS